MAATPESLAVASWMRARSHLPGSATTLRPRGDWLVWRTPPITSPSAPTAKKASPSSAIARRGRTPSSRCGPISRAAKIWRSTSRVASSKRSTRTMPFEKPREREGLVTFWSSRPSTYTLDSPFTLVVPMSSAARIRALPRDIGSLSAAVDPKGGAGHRARATAASRERFGASYQRNPVRRTLARSDRVVRESGRRRASGIERGLRGRLPETPILPLPRRGRLAGRR